MTIGALDLLLKTVEADHIRLFHERCLNRWHKDAGCRLCIEGCPSEAIILDDPIALDLDHCVNCGLCLHLCPTEVFGSGGEERLLTALAPLAGKAIELACPRKEDFGETRAGVANIVLTKKCLASFSLPILLSTVVQGVEKVWLNDEACVGCSWGVVRKWIVAIVETANRILAIFGQKPRLFTHRTSPELLERVPRERPVLWSDQPRYTRRDFFGALRRQAKGALLSIISEKLSLNGEDNSLPVEDRLPQRLPASRQLLAKILPHLGKPTMPRIEADGLPFAPIEIASNCAACGLCARLCPTGALAFNSEDGHFVLNFTLLHCLDCGICSLICPTESVAFAEQIETADLIDPSPKALLSGELAQCIQCGIPCAKAENETLCFVCRKRREWQALAG